jgi:serine protease Do
MRRAMLPAVILSAVFTVSYFAAGQSELQKSLKDLDIAAHWIYDDLPKAIAQSKATGKPILAVFRCVPCPPGRSLDVKVMQPDNDLEKLEQQFVCVRIVKTQGLDLKLFQFDYDQSWCAMFLNADLTIYGRYGTRVASGPKSDSHISLASFRKAAERALEIHKGYPGNKDQLAGHAGKEPDYAVPEKIPGLQDRAKGSATRQNCIHCHMVREYTLRAKWQEKRLTANDLWVYPMPENIGLTMDATDGLVVKSVRPESPAAKAGLAPGDVLHALNGQRLISLADIQWALHSIPAETKLAVTLRRDDGSFEKKLVTLSGDWKQSDIAWRASSWYALRHGLKTEPLSAAEKQKRAIAPDSLALTVKGLFGKGAPLLQKAGLRNNDIIVAIDGKTAAMTESQFLVYLRLTHGPGDSVVFTVLRGENRQELTIPMW